MPWSTGQTRHASRSEGKRPEGVRHRFSGLHSGGQVTHRYLTLSKERVRVFHYDADADCAMRTDETTFESFVTGRTNAMTAFLRGQVDFEGKTILVEALRALFPGPRAQDDAKRNNAA